MRSFGFFAGLGVAAAAFTPVFYGKSGQAVGNSTWALRAGAARISVTPFGTNPEWTGTITPSGVWGELFEDKNGNGKWDSGEKFEDDPLNSQLDSSSDKKYDGVYLAGFGNNRIATGKHDDQWASAVVLDDGKTRIAFVVVDLLGYFEDSKYFGLKKVRQMLDPALKIDEIILSSTHNHEGPDSLGAWGNGMLKDGKYPRYLQFVDQMIAKSITIAAADLRAVKLKMGATNPAKSPSIERMQVRTRGRPPEFFDDELRAIQIVNDGGANDGQTVATLINWGTHPESMEDKNTLLTSDFPHAVRETVEQKYGGVTLYFSGALGAVEIVGDSNVKPTDRHRFDGKDFPPDPATGKLEYTFERTMAIGRDIGKAVIDAVEAAEWSSFQGITLAKAPISATMDNFSYRLLSVNGVLDVPFRPNGTGAIVDSSVYFLRIGDAEIITTPGEVFPEIWAGLTSYRRTDCPQADTQRPLEPGVRGEMKAKYRWILGLSPDEFGYIVPGYDFRGPKWGWQGPELSSDACKAQGVPDHYHESNSASSELAMKWAEAAVALIQGN